MKKILFAFTVIAACLSAREAVAQNSGFYLYTGDAFITSGINIDQRNDEQFPLHQDRFTDEKDRTDRKRDQHHQVRRMEQFFLLCGDILITHRHPPCAWIPPLLL